MHCVGRDGAATEQRGDEMTMNKYDLLNATYEVTIGKRSGETRTFRVNLADFPANAIEKIIAYGVQRTFNDKVGGSDSTLEEKAKAVQLLIARWKRGDIGRAPAQAVDPVTAEARKLIAARLRKSKPDVWAKLKDRADKHELLDKLVERNPDIREQAEESVRKRTETAQVDLGDLDI